MRKLVVVGLIFLATVLAVWTAANVHLARRLVLAPVWPAPVTTALLWAIGVLAALPVLQPAFEHALGTRRSRWLAWPGYTYMGLAFLLAIALAATDLALGLAGAAFAAELDPAVAGLGVVRTQAAFVAFVAAGASGVAVANALRPPALRRVEIRLDRLPRALDGFRIVQISDLHIGAMRGARFARAVTERVRATAPDLIAVTGDLVDGSQRDLAAEVAPFASLRARHGVWFVTGNHDYYSGADRWIAHLQDALGWRVLRNERVTIADGEAAFDLAGVDDHRAALFGGGHGEDVGRALGGRDPGRAVVLLAHDPSTFPAAARHGVDLQLSGHTHGGQIWPFGYFVRLVVRFLAGHFERAGAQLLVSRGTGFWGPPMRLRAPSEITEVVLRSAGTYDDSGKTRANGRTS